MKPGSQTISQHMNSEAVNRRQRAPRLQLPPPPPTHTHLALLWYSTAVGRSSDAPAATAPLVCPPAPWLTPARAPHTQPPVPLYGAPAMRPAECVCGIVLVTWAADLPSEADE